MKKQTIAFTNDNADGIRMIDREVFIGFLQQFGPNVKLKLTLEHYFPQRSLSQNNTMYWYLDLLAEESGMELVKFKARMGEKYLRRPLLDKDGEHIIDEDGVIEMYVPSTADLDKAEMAIFIDKLRMFGLNYLNYELPDPDKNYKLNFQETYKKQLQNGIKNSEGRPQQNG